MRLIHGEYWPAPKLLFMQLAGLFVRGADDGV